MFGLDIIFRKVIGLFSKDLGIDLGTANTVVVARGEGIVLREPSVVAVIKGSDQVLNDGNAVGEEAKRMLGKTPADIEAIRPLREGVISSKRIAEAMITYFIRKSHGGRRFWIRPRVLVAVPARITDVEKDAVFSSAHRAGARKVFLVEEPRAAAVGAGLPIEEPRAYMVVDVGGGTSEIAIITCASLEVFDSIKIGGDAFDDSIASYIQRRHNLVIGPQTAEKIKMEIGSAVPTGDEKSLRIAGRSKSTGLPEEIEISSREVREALREPTEKIVLAVKDVLEMTQPELAADLIHTGITLTGGGSLLTGLDRLIQQETRLPCRLAENSIDCVATGCLRFLENIDMFASILMEDER